MYPRNVEKGTAKLAVTAKDVNPPEITMHIPLLCKEKGVPFVEVPSREELGAAAGIQRPTVGVAITKEGEALSVIKEITKGLKVEGAKDGEEKPAAKE